MPSIVAARRLFRPFAFTRKTVAKRARIALDSAPAVLYAVGDVHGCISQLRALETQIIADASGFRGEKLIIMLGDYVDRGPDSAAVLDHLVSDPPAGFRRICLVGNHDVAMLAFLDGRLALEAWLAIGGLNTLYSYGVDPYQVMDRAKSPKLALAAMRAAVPARHAKFLRDMPVVAYNRTYAFVHAGLRAGVAFRDQDDEDMIAIRDDFQAQRPDRIVIHGHTPVTKPIYRDRRICLDTGAYYSGVMTALRIADRDLALIATG